MEVNKHKKTQNAAKVARLRRAVDDNITHTNYVKETGLCVCCRQSEAFTMTCERKQCIRSFVLFEPWNCPKCKSMDFARIPHGYDNQDKKLYNCAKCGTLAIRGGYVEVPTLHEGESRD